MKIIDLNGFSGIRYAISDVSVIKQTNLWSVCHNPAGRIYNGFLLLVSGECVYEWDGEAVKLSAGALIYLPKGSTHTVRAEERSIEFYRINFTLSDADDGEEIILSKTPVLISESVPRNIIELSEELRRATLLPRGAGFKSLSMLAEILDYARGSCGKISGGRIGEAIEYVNDHYTEEIPISLLADKCFISVAHLFRLFKESVGMSPIDYKNSLRIRKAESLLTDPDLSIGEIAEMLGFENACYFSRIFKKRTGLSPIQFRKNNRV